MWPFRKKRQQLPYSALINSSNRILLALSTNVAVIVFLNEATMDTTHVPGVNYYRPEDPFRLAREPTRTYPEWTWSVGERRFVRTRAELLTKEVRDRSRLAVEKGRTTENIMRGISIARYPFSTGVLFQESVYVTKKAQAEECKRSGYPEDEIMQYPYVLQYADFAGLTLRQAADDILFKAKLDDELLAKTELLRLKYFNAVKRADRVEELEELYEAFMRESFKNALV
jgi:hypothetical protein